jgi:hypothetical protein
MNLTNSAYSVLVRGGREEDEDELTGVLGLRCNWIIAVREQKVRQIKQNGFNFCVCPCGKIHSSTHIKGQRKETIPLTTFHMAKHPGKAKGRQSWVKGSKEKFLDKRHDEFLTAHEAQSNTITTFYDKMTHLWFHKYGFDLPLDQDMEGDIPEPEEHLADQPVDFSDLTVEEQEKRSKLYKEL